MKKTAKRILSWLMAVALLTSYMPTLYASASKIVPSEIVNAITDPGTADSWESMMGTSNDGNRYAGRVWVDKSVYKAGDTVVLTTNNQPGASFVVEDLAEDEAFQVVFSALGSSMTTTTTTSKTGPLDVVLILDNSVSMNTTSGGTTRMQKVIEAANSMLRDILKDNQDVRLGIVAYAQNASTILPFGDYDDGVQLRVNRYTGSGSSNGVISAYTTAGNRINRNYQSAGYANYTNIQAGFDLGMDMLANANTTENRKPVVILLTDGAANTAVTEKFYDVSGGTARQVYYSNNIDPMIALSTLLGNAYNKALVEEKYGKNPMVYGIGVDLSATDGSNAIIDPKNNFNSNNRNSNIVTAYNRYVRWAAGETIQERSGTGSTYYNFNFDHNYPEAGITDADVIQNIHYVDTYYPVSGADVSGVFDQIYQELSSGVFNPISSTTVDSGATGVRNTPLIYVDFIGQYMEVKQIQSVTLFGKSYGVTDNGDGTYIVQTGIGKNPTTGESYNTSEDIRITTSRQSDGTQKLQIEIDQEVLPILLEKVDVRDVNGQQTTTITEIVQQPLRVYYTIGLDSEILLPNGTVDISKIDSSYQSHVHGNQVDFYSNRFGVMNTNDNGDTHVGFKPSKANRYYYHQSNVDIFTAVSRKDGKAINWQADEYGIPYEADTFDFTWLTYEKYSTLQDSDQVYTYVTYHRPISGNSDAAEEVTYLIYSDWAYMKESVAFYDSNANTYINAAPGGYTTGDVGYAIPVEQVETVISAYKAANQNAQIYGMLGVESLRTSRLHNMTVTKSQNMTGTATNRYAPEYTYETASVHNDNDVVVWLGNNGKLTVEIDTGIALTKRVTEAIGNPDDTYNLTVTVPVGVNADPEVKDANGGTVASTYSGNVLTIPVKADQTVYITGIPGGTVCAIGETIPAGKDYYISDSTATVTVPTLMEVLAGAEQFVPASVTNAPYKYGNLTIVKDVSHNLEEAPESMLQKEFTFQVQLNPVPQQKTYLLDTSNASLITAQQIVVAEDGTFTVKLKDNESVTVIGLPEGTGYTVTEVSVPAGYTNTTGVVTGTVAADGENHVHIVNVYNVTPIKPAVTITGTKTLTDVNGTYTDNEAFVFVLSRYNGTDYDQLATTTARAGESYAFHLENALAESMGVGEHYFRVTEQTGTTPGMTYDATRGLFKIIVTDENADGTLEFAVTDAGNTQVVGNTVTKNFVNYYNVERTSVDISITKELTNKTGVQLPLNLFHFLLENTAKPDGDSHIPSKTITTDASGKAVIRLSDLGPGEYRYTLREVAGSLPGMIYDSTSYVISVTVEEVEGVLVATTRINDAESSTVTFHNTYKLNAISHTISGTKVLQGRDLKDGEFRFALYETDASFALAENAVAKQIVSNSGDSFSFSEIMYTQVGTYYYSVKEVVPASKLPGVTYDTTHYHVTVVVTAEGENLKKTVTINKIGHNADATDGLVFVNNYTAKATEIAISGTKVLTGRSQHAGEFTFQLFDENGVKIGETTNKANGSFTFASISYDKVGVYHYTIREVAGNAPGVAYDSREIAVTVNVTDQEATLVATADKSAAEVRFENVYTSASATATIRGTKKLEGGSLEADMFSFLLYETDSGFEMTGSPIRETGHDAKGNFSFGTLTYNIPGTYFYLVVEDTADMLEGIVYDRTQHKLMVQVADVGDGQLRASITELELNEVTQPAAAAAISVNFTNATFDEAVEKTVSLANATTMIDGQKVNEGDVLTYHITYTNYTGLPVVVDIMDTIPNHTTYVEGSASQGGTYAGTHVNWILPVGANKTVTVSFQVEVTAEDAVVANTAIVRDGVNEYVTNEVVNHTFEEIFVKDVFVADAPTVSIDGQKVEAGDELVYEIRFTNASGEAKDITITDSIPVGTTSVEGSADRDGVYENGVIVWQLQNVAPWETVIVTFKVKVNEQIGEATIRNRATATEGENTYETNLVSNHTEERQPENPGASDNPQTGDDTKLHLWVMLLVTSSLGFGATILLGRKKENEIV